MGYSSVEDWLDSCYTYRNGQVIAKIDTQRKVKGDALGSPDKLGYLKTVYKGKTYGIHRIVWFLHHRAWPEVIDHKDRDPTNNRIENLRDGSHTDNMSNLSKYKNNSSGFTGIRVKFGKFYAIRSLGKRGQKQEKAFQYLSDAIVWRVLPKMARLAAKNQ